MSRQTEEGASVAPSLVYSGDALGTKYTVKITGDTAGDPVAGQSAGDTIALQLKRVNDAMSTWIEDSELSAFNRHPAGEAFPLSPDALAVFTAAQAVSETSGGAFDVTVGPIVNLWGFGPDPSTHQPPSSEAIEEARLHTGYRRLSIDSAAKTITKSDEALYCDLSAIAKGFAVDAIAAALDKQGFQNYMAEVGGEVRAQGLNTRGKPWQLAIERPSELGSAIHRIVPLTNQSMATSGNYRNYYEVDGTRYSHTIDPTTSRPVTHNTASVTVIHDECMYADAWATALLVLGYEKGHELAEHEGLAVLWINEGPSGELEDHMSTAFEAVIGEKAVHETAI